MIFCSALYEMYAYTHTYKLQRMITYSIFTHTHTHTHTHTCICKRRRKRQHTTVFLPGEFHGYHINSIIFLLSECFLKFCSTLKFSSFKHMTSYIPIIAPPSPTTQYCIPLIPSPHW